MQFFEHTCRTAAEDLALDEALLERAEQAAADSARAANAARGDFEVLRVWEFRRPTVVLGRSSQVEVEANVAECRRRGVEILRRTSGGAAIVAGPGCLMYSVVLSYGLRPPLRSLDEAHRFVLGTVLQAIRPTLPAATICGTSDLAVDDRKFSGNSLRCRREHLLYHGTLLYDFSLASIAACLGTPPRQPEYRVGRPHEQFVANVNLSRRELTAGLRRAFGAAEPLVDWPQAETAALVEAKYCRDEWNYGPKDG